MTLSPVWQARIEKLQETPPPAASTISLPINPTYYAGGLTFIDNKQSALSMLQLASELQLSHVGVDTEFGYSRPPTILSNETKAYDPRSVKPLLLSLTLVESPKAPGANAEAYEFVIDLREKDTYESVAALLRLPVTFVGHFLQAEFHCLWSVGLPVPERVWDTWVAEKVQHLGRHHLKNKLTVVADEAAEIRAKEEAGRDETLRLRLVDTCRRYGVPYPFAAGDKERLQNSFLGHPNGDPFTDEQRRYAAADATAAAGLYVPQVMAATVSDTLSHLMTIEMPWIKVNAGMAWRGVRIDADSRDHLRDACDRKLPVLTTKLAELGIKNHRSIAALKTYFAKKGLLGVFRRGDGYSFNKDRLKEMRHLDPAIELIYETRKVEWLGNDAILTPALVSGIDGRVHPQHRHLGTASGRQSASQPNVLGLDRTLKPLIIPADGYGIGEVDLSQIEIGVAAAVYGDERLVEMYNAGDVYSSMAQRFYHEQLDDAARVMDGTAFKKAHPQLRNVMKTCTLGIIYGLTPHGLAPRLQVSVQQAERMLNEFMNMFPVLKQGLQDAWRHGARRGYAVTATGLRRYRGSGGPLSNWEKNWMRNHPVQGSAAAAFKLAGIRLSKLYPQYNATLILAVHDAYVFEAPSDVLAKVAELTRTVMCDAVREMFPMLRPRAEINIGCPSCWNKDGDDQALEKWVADAGAAAA